MAQIRWNITVSPDTDETVRAFLADEVGGQGLSLSRLIEEAVRAYVFELTANRVKHANAAISEPDMEAMVEEAVQWARNA